MIPCLQNQYHAQLELERIRISANLSPASKMDDIVGQKVQQQKLLRLQSIERALRRLENGKFGFCTLCHQPILSERLQALPDAETCASCQKKIERENRRPIWR